MNRIRIRLISRVAVPLFLAAGILQGAAQTPQAIRWTMSAKALRPPKSHATAVAHVHAAIQPGWHLYALDQEPGGPIATRISLPAGQPFTIAGDIDQPTPMTSIDPNFNLETRFYEDEVTFAVPVQSTPNAKTRSGKLAVDVLYQTCNDTMCLPPTVAHLTALIERLKPQ